MIHDSQGHGEIGNGRRILAVVAGRVEQAQEVAARFAAEGDDVEARWYSTPVEFLEQPSRPRFEAVILFPELDDASTDADEHRLRLALADTPLFRVA